MWKRILGMNFQKSSIKYSSNIVHEHLEILDAIKVVSFGVRPFVFLLVNQISGSVRIWQSFFW